MTMKERVMRMKEGKLWRALSAAALLWLLTVPAVAEEAQETMPYPERTILYIVDCSGSMDNYQKALNSGRQMLLDLLPEESEVVAFNTEAFTPALGEKLTFEGNTSVLNGIREADQKLEEIWAEHPETEVTAVLFSDMYSTVKAEKCDEELDQESAKKEKGQLASISRRWSNYVRNGKLRFYVLDWPSPNRREASKCRSRLALRRLNMRKAFR